MVWSFISSTVPISGIVFQTWHTLCSWESPTVVPWNDESILSHWTVPSYSVEVNQATVRVARAIASPCSCSCCSIFWVLLQCVSTSFIHFMTWCSCLHLHLLQSCLFCCVASFKVSASLLYFCVQDGQHATKNQPLWPEIGDLTCDVNFNMWFEHKKYPNPLSWMIFI